MTATPWRDGYRLKDPARPCYTCGARPTGSVGGQPVYPASCRHDPITPDPGTLDLRDYAPVRVSLTEVEWTLALRRAERIVRIDADRGWRMKFEPVGETQVDVHARGFAAELAAHRVTGLELHWDLLERDYRRRDKPPDLGQRTEVRNARRRDGRLVAHPGERSEYLYLLVTGEGREYLVVGFMEGVELMIPRRWEEPPRVQYAGWFATQRSLAPIAELPVDA